MSSWQEQISDPAGLGVDHGEGEPGPVPCEAFALCPNPADGFYPHPILGDVPSCRRCAEKLEETLVPFGGVGS